MRIDYLDSVNIVSKYFTLEQIKDGTFYIYTYTSIFIVVLNFLYILRNFTFKIFENSPLSFNKRFELGLVLILNRFHINSLFPCF